MNGAGFTGSAVERVMLCPTSAALPAVHGDTSDDADDGQIVHGFLYAGATRGRDAALAEVTDPDLRARCEAIDLGELASIGKLVAAEVAYAYDVATDTARILGQNLGRKYPALAPTEIATTTDLELESEDGTRIVLDAKSGWKHVHDETPQIRFHALAVQRARGVDLVRVGILRVPADGRLRPPRLVDVDDLDAGAFAHEIRETWRAVVHARELVAAGRVPDVTVGEHCQYCPARRSSCPAHLAIVREVLGLPAPKQIADHVLSLSPEQKGEAWAWKTRAKAVLEALDGALLDALNEGPIPLPDGREVVLTPVSYAKAVMVPDPSGATKLVSFVRPTTRKRKAS